ncbi:MAG: di-heme-cytochrome C peroxidase, partial [Chthoniobacteraceae bacterium]
VRVLSQNWTDADARAYYNTSQGSRMMPLAWFLNLEQEKSTVPFNDAANLRALGYLPRSKDANGNQSGLPIGFAQDGDSVGLTCSACHTAQINFKGTAWLIDGGPTLANAQSMMTSLAAALKATRDDAGKFDRFAKAVLGANSSDAGKASLKTSMDPVIRARSDYNARNFPSAGQPGFGPGRIDAFDAIFNEVVVRFAHVGNAKTQCDAPVSYPFLWDTPQHDVVQWNGSARNLVIDPLHIHPIHIGALGRNIGEVLGVFADVDTEKVQEFPPGSYTSSVKVKNLDDLENLLRNLWSPKWPEAAFGKPDQKLVDAGAVLFRIHCAECHESINRTDPNRKVTAVMRDVHTDQSMARNAATRTSESGVFRGKTILTPAPHVIADTEPVGTLLSFLGQRTLLGANLFPSADIAPMSEVKVEINEGSSKLLLTLNAPELADGKMKMAHVKSLKLWQAGKNTIVRDGEDLKDLTQLLAQDFDKVKGEVDGDSARLKIEDMAKSPVQFQYKGRPLNGIWATAPYLHNGSVPTLDDLLKPASARKPTFKLGSREFDPVKVGYVDEGDFIFDTKANPGNSNAGHEYGETVFTDAERAQLIEYMKTL